LDNLPKYSLLNTCHALMGLSDFRILKSKGKLNGTPFSASRIPGLPPQAPFWKQDQEYQWRLFILFLETKKDP